MCLKLAGKGQIPLAVSLNFLLFFVVGYLELSTVMQTRVYEKLRFDRVRSSQLNGEDLRDRWHNALRKVEAGGIIDPETIKLRVSPALTLSLFMVCDQ